MRLGNLKKQTRSIYTNKNAVLQSFNMDAKLLK